MTSEAGGGGESQKADERDKKQNQMICDSDKGEGGKKIGNFLRTSKMEAPYHGFE